MTRSESLSVKSSCYIKRAISNAKNKQKEVYKTASISHFINLFELYHCCIAKVIHYMTLASKDINIALLDIQV